MPSTPQPHPDPQAHPDPHPHLPAGARCIRNLRRDFVEWHRGRRRYALWAIDADSPVLRHRVEQARAHLGGLLLDGYRRQPHVTLSLCGFPSPAPSAPDECDASSVERQVAMLVRARPAPFGISVGGLSSFAMSPFLTVSDDEAGLSALRDRLGPGCDGGAWTPHVTVGLYAGDWPAGPVRSRLSAFPKGPALRVPVTRVTLFTYDASEIDGTLERVAEFGLDDGRLRWLGRPL